MKNTFDTWISVCLLVLGCAFVITVGTLTWMAVGGHADIPSREGLPGIAMVFATIAYGLGWFHVERRLF